MKQRVHKSLVSLAALKKPRIREAAKLPKRANEATCVFAFFAIAAAGRISEKNPAFSAHIDRNGPVPPI
jgi:hypothetical protein